MALTSKSTLQSGSGVRPLPAKAAQIAAEARGALAARLGRAALPVWPGGQAVEIAPGAKVTPLTDAETGRVLIFDLEPQGNGLYKAVARVRSRRVRLGRPEAMRKLGIAASYNTLRRLIVAGFVKGEQIAPNTVQMDLESYFEHEAATADPEFWTRNNHANTKKLRLAVSGTRWGCGGDYKGRRKPGDSAGPLS